MRNVNSPTFRRCLKALVAAAAAAVTYVKYGEYVPQVVSTRDCC